MMRLFFLLLTTFVFCGISGQSSDSSSPVERVQSRAGGEGQVTVRQSQAIDQLMRHYVQTNRSQSGVEGFRIQLYSGTGAQARQAAQDVRTRVMGSFPDEKVMVEYNEPIWRVRVGSFRHRHEALPLLRRLKTNFPSIDSYIVRDPSIRAGEFK
jgi:hypothetical protein